MTAIDRAWLAVERGDPTALRQCVVAMSMARDVLVGLVGRDVDATTVTHDVSEETPLAADSTRWMRAGGPRERRTK